MFDVKSSRSVKLFLHETPSIFPSSRQLVAFDPATLTLRLFVLIGCFPHSAHFLIAIVILHLLRLKHKNFDDWTIEGQRLSVEGHVLFIKDLQRNYNPASTMHRQSWGKGFWEIFHIKTCLNTWNRRQRTEMGNSHRQRGMATYPQGCGDASSCCVITGLENTVQYTSQTSHTVTVLQQSWGEKGIHCEWQMRDVLKVCFKKSRLVSRQVDQTLFYIHEGFFCLCCYPRAVQVSFKFLQCKHMYNL